MNETFFDVSDTHEQLRCQADALYEFFVTRNTKYRLGIVASIKQYYLKRFATELANPRDGEIQALLSVFDHAMDASRLGRRLQTAIVVFAIMTQPRIKEYFCQRPPASSDDTDFCRCDRTAFVHWETHQLDLLEPLLLSGNIPVDQWLDDTVLDYILYLGAVPTTGTAGRNRPCTQRVRPTL